MKTIKIIGMAAIASTMLFASCSKDENSDGKTPVKVRMTDAPLDVDAVLIDLLEVNIKMEEEGWVTLNTNAGIYNLLDFSNGKDTVIANDTLPSGAVKEIRLVLGENNHVVVDGDTFALTIPSGSSSGLKIKFDGTFTANQLAEIKIDFDAAMSIKKENSGDYKLRPVIRIIAKEDNDTKLEGQLKPEGARANVFAILNGDTLSGAITDSEGEFEMIGLLAGTYNLAIMPDTLYADTTISNVNMVLGVKTDLGDIQLRLK